LESYFVYLLSRFALASVGHLPRPGAILILEALARLVYRLDRSHRAIARVNLTIAFPGLTPGQREGIARKSFQSAARNLLEVSRMPGLNRENIRGLVQYDPQRGLSNYELAAARGRGILYLTGHFSAWELLPAAHALYGHPLSFVTRPLDNARLEEHLFKLRELTGNRVIYKRNSARRILEELKAGGSVGILMDQNTSLQEGIYADLFGLPAATSTSIALLALRTEATVLPGYLSPAPQGRYTIKFLPPVELTRTGDTSSDIAENTRAFNRILEGIIREQPETWLWGHKRWKNQPGEAPPDLYRLSPEELRAFLSARQTQPGQGISP
jgi:KDO2-lipid IV(A) lauroyltransferase